MTRKNILLLTFIAIIAHAHVFALSENAKDKVFIKFERAFIESRALDQTKSIKYSKADNILKIGVTDFDALAQKYKVSNLRRVFRYAGKFEQRHKDFGLDLFYEVTFGNNSELESIISDLSVLDIVESVEPVPICNTKEYTQPDDSKFSEQWGLYNQLYSGIDINVLPAWEITTGDPRVVIAIIDNSFDYVHEDLKDNIWTNSGEIPENGIDDDDNGYIDDIMGWNFRNNVWDVQNDHKGDQHGTHVGGIVAARSNNAKGVAGIAGGWGDSTGVSLMVFRTGYSDQDGSGIEYIAYGFEAMIYAADMGAAIAQCSWGGTGSSTPAVEAINYFTLWGGGTALWGGLVIAAAGNSNTDFKHYPAAYPYVLGVGSIDATGSKSYFSNYGSYVDICAPGSDIMSTLPYSTYGSLSGTSMACPMVSGVAALVLSAAYDVIPFEKKTPFWLETVLTSTVVETQSQYEIGGMVNAKAAIDYALRNVNNEALKPAFNISVYPNPASNVLNVIAGFTESYDYSIYDISGHLMKAEKNQKNNKSIDISSYNSGAYIMVIKKDNKQQVKTFIKK
jgi:subtilisin family serine protease